MSRFGPVRCFECGNPLDDMREAFEWMRAYIDSTVKKRSAIGNRMLDPQSSVYLNDIFDALGIPQEKICCRKSLLANVKPEYLETRGTSSLY